MSQQYANFKVRDVFGMPDIPEKVLAKGYADSSNPFIPQTHADYVFRKEFLRECLAFLKDPSGDAYYVTGPTGSGKTSGITEITGRLNWPVQQITANGRLEFTDLVGHHALISPKPGETPVMQFMYGPLAIAMREGHVLLINEVDLVDPAELSGLNDILEGRPLVIAQNGGEIIKPHPMFRVIVTGNSTGSGDPSGLYQGVMMQNLAAMDRYRFSVVPYMAEQDERGVLERVVPRLPDNIRNGMVRIANEIRKLFMGENGDDGQISITMSTRTLVRWAKLTLQFRGAPNAIEYALQQSLLIRASSEEKEAVIRIAKDVFGEQWR
ncbi:MULTISPECIES: AAA family ATPase [Vibrionaceae]|uniref:CbbQ/NirQ/NorQ/GpvN family protein n=1 Tax=Vibrio alginolyticus TaxID=663 RepID=A0A1P8DNL5_VIBAL|nr:MULTISPECIES: AAA family ATPase [Vibrionaceae]HAS6097035.1 AAA domain-containing protein [Vibrio vulnificus]APU90716.1 CbbQ/NirQ/NorQ/GpvN family protein [Vibrio alginolyticus]ELA9387125.1 CbbQ/NirQ/NorQ C-terminal domain-containing protein [Vibrio parahaemolyticus]KAB1503372.1 AAA domain-containing protein [Photobacterium damselae subsp. damselae]MBE5145790.1 AAA domain-containing protein [Vibrio parahaemolyticus]